MKKLLLALTLCLLSVSTLAPNVWGQSNVRPMYDNTANGGITTQTVDPSHGLPVQIVAPGSAGSATPLPIYSPATIRVTAALTVTASSAYAPGNVVGSLMTFTSATRVAGAGGILQTAVLRDKAGQNVSYDLFLFDSAPTTPTNKTAIALSAADLAKSIGTVSLTGAVLGAASTMALMTATGQGMSFKLSSGTTLYGILVTRGAPTYASTSDVSVDLIIMPD